MQEKEEEEEMQEYHERIRKIILLIRDSKQLGTNNLSALTPTKRRGRRIVRKKMLSQPLTWILTWMFSPGCSIFHLVMMRGSEALISHLDVQHLDSHLDAQPPAWR